ncbi:hypothetical protein FGO68_gene13734 [Halteria grandinella]|uniref:Uncharacterized protein n=1 Tax=Halteria grandinella TaxID=5974 RepID=A0A8J8NKC6_HALGN|nr:hypothetical protein FGO68_gene13734 [Halteria grandinella]
MPEAVRSPFAFTHNNTLSILGGCRGPKDHSTNLQQCDLLTRQWTVRSVLQQGRSCFMGEVIGNGKVWVSGGFDGYESIKSAECVELNGGGSSRKMKGLGQPMKNSVSLRQGEEIYIFGGWDGKSTLDKIFKYTHSTQSTSFVGYLPYALESPAHCQADDSTLFLFGGFDSYGVTGKIIKVDLRNMEAVEYPGVNLAVKRENCTAQMLNGEYIVVAGGWGGGKAISQIEVFRYDKETKTLTRDDSMGEELLFPRNRPCSIGLI